MDGLRGLEAIISVFISNTEFSSIKYEAETQTIQVEVALREELTEDQKKDIVDHTCRTMRLFYEMSGINPQMVEMDINQKDGVAIVGLRRDIGSLEDKELGLYLELLRERCRDVIIMDEGGDLNDDSLHTRVGSSLLQKIRKQGQLRRNIFAYREEGRLFVFNK